VKSKNYKLKSSIFEVALICVVMFSLLIPGRVIAQEQVRLDLQINLFMKILRYDRNIAERGEEGLKMGVLYNPADKKSVKLKDDFLEEFDLLEDKTIKDIPLFVLAVAGAAELDKAIENYHINILYIAPGLDNQMDSILKTCEENSILSLTAVEKYAENGVAVGLGIVDEKPEIIINTSVSRAVGADFGADILKLARVIK